MKPITFYRRAGIVDVESLVNLRLAFLTEISGLGVPEDQAMRESLRGYFSETIASGEFIAFIAETDKKVIASSGLIVHRHAPSNRNPTGREGYIMNMYTVPGFRGRGIATRLLQMLVDQAKECGCGKVSLHAMAKGREIYAKAGFVGVETEMRLNL